jgi:hypothetical protein
VPAAAPDERPAPDDWPPREDDTVLDDGDHDDHDHDGDDGHDRTAGRDWTSPAEDTVPNDAVGGDGGDDRTAARDCTKPADDTDRDNGHDAEDWTATDDWPAQDDAHNADDADDADDRHAAHDYSTGPDDGAVPDDSHGAGDADDRHAAHDSIGLDDGAVPDDSHDADDWNAADDGGDAYGWNASCNRDGPEDWMAPYDDPGPEDWDDPDDHGTAANTGLSGVPGNEAAEDAFTRRMLAGSLPARLAALKQHAYSHGLAADTGQRPNRHTLYVHLTDKALATGNGVLRVEELGPLLLNQLSELLGHDQIVVKPVIDLREQVSVHSYEIPDRIRERVRLRHPVDMFPYGAAEATTRMDQDHITPYDRTGPPGPRGQTDPDNLIPLGRLHHRAKTFGGWQSRRLPTGGVEWTSPHGFRFHVDHTGTHPVPPDGMADPS